MSFGCAAKLDTGALLTAFSSSDWTTYTDICRCSSARQNNSKSVLGLSESSGCVYLTALRLTECTGGAAVQCAPSKLKSSCTTARVDCYKYPTSTSSSSFWCQPAIWTHRAETCSKEASGCIQNNAVVIVGLVGIIAIVVIIVLVALRK